MALLIWTEQEPDGTSWTDCTYCSLLMVLEANGTKFPLGARTHAERKAFRAGDPRLNFAGGVSRAASRYGVAVKNLNAANPTALRAALSVEGNAFAVAGRLSNFPSGHRLRAFAPNFTGFHAVAVIPDGEGKVRWMDPLAPMNTIPKTATVAEVLTFAAGNYPNDARYLAVKEDNVDQKTVIKEKPFLDGPHIATIPAGTKVDGWDEDSLVKTQVWPIASSLQVSGTAHFKQTPQAAPNGTFWMALNGLYAGLYIPYPQLVLGAAVNPPPPPADCSVQEKQIEDLQTNLTAMTKVANAQSQQLDEIEAAVKTLADLVE